MLWVKALHIVFVASWFAGLFYLPRIYVNLAMVAPGSAAERDRLLLMARKLLRFTTLLAVPALAFGLWLWLGYGIGRGSGWMHAKLAVVLLVIGYHHACAVMLRKFAAGAPARSHRWYRWFNELPVLLLLAAVVLVVVKPF
jgi:protoporphyrinogen IX oxidase